MLNPKQLQTIAEKAWLHDHDWEMISIMSAEPFLCNDFLYYWDGTHLAICSWPLDKTKMNSDLAPMIQEITQKLLKDFDPLMIEMWGPRDIDLAPVLPHAFSKVYSKEANPFNVNFQIELQDYRVPKGSHRENANRAKRWGYTCIPSRGPLTWQHFQLIDAFLNRKDLQAFDRIYTAIEPWIANLPNTRLFNVYQDGILLGFKSMREISSRIVITKSSYYRPGVKHISDFLTRSIIEYYQAQGTKVLDMGYSGHKNLYNYKKHWKPNINNGSYHEIAYAYRSYTPKSSYGPWWARDILCPALSQADEDCD